LSDGKSVEHVSELTDKEFTLLNYVGVNYAVDVEPFEDFMEIGQEQLREIISKLELLDCVHVREGELTVTKRGSDSLNDYRKKKLSSMSLNDLDKLGKINQEMNDVGEHLRYTVVKYQLGVDSLRRIVEAVEEIHGRLTKILRELRDLLPHFDYYIARLEQPYMKIKSGNELFIAKEPSSYYNVYWQLHTDLGSFPVEHG
jgi:hypothetical protein